MGIIRAFSIPSSLFCAYYGLWHQVRFDLEDTVSAAVTSFSLAPSPFFYLIAHVRSFFATSFYGPKFFVESTRSRHGGWRVQRYGIVLILLGSAIANRWRDTCFRRLRGFMVNFCHRLYSTTTLHQPNHTIKNRKNGTMTSLIYRVDNGHLNPVDFISFSWELPKSSLFACEIW